MRRCVDYLTIMCNILLVAVLTINGELIVETRFLTNFKHINIAIDGVLACSVVCA